MEGLEAVQRSLILFPNYLLGGAKGTHVMEYFAEPVSTVGETSFDGVGEYAVEGIGVVGSIMVPVGKIGK